MKLIGIAAAFVLFLLSRTTLAGLSGPPASYFIPANDDKHILVLLAPLPATDDTRELAELPNGESVHLRSEFPQSGLYEVGSNTPIWTIDWHDGFCFLSPNSRYLVRVRDFGDLCHPNDEDSGWAIEFYADGRLVNQHGVQALIDYPSLIPYWHHSILRDDYVDGDLEIREGIFTLHTFTHERYLFDVATGAIIEEFRLWRTASRYAYGLLAVILVALSCSLIQRVRRRRMLAGEEPVSQSSTIARGRQKGVLSFKLRSMMLFTTAVVILCFPLGFAPHVAVLLMCFATSILLTIATLRVGRSVNLPATKIRTRLLHLMLIALTLTSWLSCYGLSLAPTMSALQALGAPYDVRMVVAKTLYAPVYFILTSTALETNQSVENYFGDWGT